MWKDKAIPAQYDLFKVPYKDADLDYARLEDYHNIICKTMCVSQHSRPDTQLTRGYHYTRVTIVTEREI